MKDFLHELEPILWALVAVLGFSSLVLVAGALADPLVTPLDISSSANWRNPEYDTGWPLVFNGTDLSASHAGPTSALGGNDAYYATPVGPDPTVCVTVSRFDREPWAVIWIDLLINQPGSTAMTGYGLAYNDPCSGCEVENLRLYYYSGTRQYETELAKWPTLSLPDGSTFCLSKSGSTLTVWYQVPGGPWQIRGQKKDTRWSGTGYIAVGLIDPLVAGVTRISGVAAGPVVGAIDATPPAPPRDLRVF